MKVKIDFISDFICPWCYLGKVRLKRIKETLRGEGIQLLIELKPYLLYPDIPPGGLDKSHFKKTKPGFGTALKQAAREEQISINYRNIQTIPSSLDMHRLAWIVNDLEKRFEMSNRVFHDYFKNGQNIEDPIYLRDLGQEFDISQKVETILNNPSEAKEAVLNSIAQTHSSGISIVPTLCFGPSINLPGLQSYDVWMNYIRRALRMQNSI